MGHPRPELPGREMGRGIYHRRWDIQDGKLADREMGRGIYHRRWDIQDEEVGHPRWELACGTGGTGS